MTPFFRSYWYDCGIWSSSCANVLTTALITAFCKFLVRLWHDWSLRHARAQTCFQQLWWLHFLWRNFFGHVSGFDAFLFDLCCWRKRSVRRERSGEHKLMVSRIFFMCMHTIDTFYKCDQHISLACKKRCWASVYVVQLCIHATWIFSAMRKVLLRYRPCYTCQRKEECLSDMSSLNVFMCIYVYMYVHLHEYNARNTRLCVYKHT